jgi:hypothetical protein
LSFEVDQLLLSKQRSIKMNKFAVVFVLGLASMAAFLTVGATEAEKEVDSSLDQMVSMIQTLFSTLH